MTHSELIKAMAAATKISEATVTLFLRILREAGLITTGARGVNAPPMKIMDAARLLLALTVTDKPSRAARAVQDFGTLRCSNIEQKGKNTDFTFAVTHDLDAEHTLEDGLATLIGIYAQYYNSNFFVNSAPAGSGHLGEDFGPYLPMSQMNVRVSSMDASINIPGAIYYYHDKFLTANTDRKMPSRDQHDENLAWLNELNALNGAHFEKLSRYRTRIRIEKKILTDVIDEIARHFDEDRETSELAE